MDNGQATADSAKVILEGVPRIGFGIHESPFPGSLYSYLQYTGDPIEYDLLMGFTGAAFRRFWSRDDGGNIDLSYLGDEPFHRVFEALGYAWEKVPVDRAAMIAGVRRSLAVARPAISFGILGPPEAGLVTGYAEDGAVLYGWSYFQDWPEYNQPADRYYECRDWFETMDKHGTKGLILIGEKSGARPDPRDLLVSALEWAIDLERSAVRPECPDHAAGLAAYEAWAAAMEIDADYPTDNVPERFTRIMVHGDQCTMTIERHNAAGFLRKTVHAVPGLPAEVAAHLNAAADLYDGDDMMRVLWPWSYDMGEEAQLGLADPAARRTMAAAVRTIQKREAEAVAHLEQALAAMQ